MGEGTGTDEEKSLGSDGAGEVGEGLASGLEREAGEAVQDRLGVGFGSEEGLEGGGGLVVFVG
jgi:hypothetical protein